MLAELADFRICAKGCEEKFTSLREAEASGARWERQLRNELECRSADRLRVALQGARPWLSRWASS